MELAPHQKAAVDLFARRLNALEIDAAVYCEYIVSILLDNDDCSAEDAVEQAVEALSAVTPDDAAQSLVEELWCNLNDESLGIAVADNIAETAAAAGLGQCTEAISGDSAECSTAREQATSPVHAVNNADDPMEQLAGDISLGLLTHEAAGELSNPEHFDDEAALEEFLEDCAHQEWLNDDGLQSEQSIFGLLNFHYSRSQHGDGYGDGGVNLESESSEPRRACIFFLSGSCFRSDCQFSHAISNTVCKYWASGSCLKGDDCPFSHVSPSTASVGEHTATADEKVVLLSADDFPSLTGEAREVASSNCPVRSASVMNAGTWTDKVKAAGRSPVQSSPQSAASSRLSRVKAQAGAAPIKWVPVGDSLSELYSDLRHQALAHGSARNKCFQKAVESYRAGDKAAARSFSRQGHHHDEQMKRLHEKAAEEMFFARNAGSARNVIDVHGLHIQEALSRLDSFLSELQHGSSGSRAAGAYAYVITGTGHHSVQSGYKAKLQPVLIEDLRKRKLQVFDCSKDGRGGLLRITL